MIASGAVSVPLLHPHRRVSPRHAQDHDFAGALGPQVVEGWYGVPFEAPLARTREYVQIVRAVLQRAAALTSGGPHYPLPLPGGTGLGKPLKSNVHPLRADLPVLLAAEGPKNVALAAEIADGWLAFLYSPHHEHTYRDALEEGFSRAGARRTPDSFDVVATVPVSLGEDVDEAAQPVREVLALYLGGMGARRVNFHYDVAVRMGFGSAAAQVRKLYEQGRRADAAAAVPLELVFAVALVGPPAKIRADLAPWRSSLVTELVVQGPPEVLRTMVDLVKAEG